MKHEFRKYQHVENNLHSKECQGLLDGVIVIQPKLDGSNCQIWMEDDDLIICSRNNVLSLSKDNHKCYQMLFNNERLKNFFRENSNLKLVGEWLAPHRVKYKEDAYYKFYVFDVIYLDDDMNGASRYMDYIDAAIILDSFGLSHVPYVVTESPVFPISTSIMNWFDKASNNFKPSFENFLCEESDDFICEGIVVKNYAYRNPFGHQVWCKIINEKFYKQQRAIQKEKIVIDDSKEALFVSENITDHLLFKKLDEFKDLDIKKTGQFIRACQLEFLDDFKEKVVDLNIKSINNNIAKYAKELYFERRKNGSSY